MEQIHIKKAQPLKGSHSLPSDFWINWHSLSLALFSSEKTTLESIAETPFLQTALGHYKDLGYHFERDENSLVIPEQNKKPKLIDEPIIPEHEVILMTLLGIFLGFESTNTLTLCNKYISNKVIENVLKTFECVIIDQSTEESTKTLTIRVSGFRNRKMLSLKKNYLTKIATLYYQIIKKEACKWDVTESGPDHLERKITLFSQDIKLQVTNTDSMNELEKRMLRKLGQLEKPSQKILFPENFKLNGTTLLSPSDCSSASILILAATLIKGSQLTLENISMNPSRISLINALKRMGATLTVTKKRQKNNEASATVTTVSSELVGRRFDFKAIEGLRDEIPLLIIAGAFAKGKTILRNVSFLRDYEADLLSKIILDLKSVQVEIGEVEDGLVIKGKESYDGRIFNTQGYAMMGFAYLVFALKAHGESVIEDIECMKSQFNTAFEILTPSSPS